MEPTPWYRFVIRELARHGFGDCNLPDFGYDGGNPFVNIRGTETSGVIGIAGMKVFESISNLEGIGQGWAVTIGNFDGVHRGHQEILRRAGVAAHAAHAIGVAVVTFDPHPMALLHPDRAPGILTPLPYRIRLLEQYGVDCLIILQG